MLPLGSLVVFTRSLPSESGYYWHGKLLLSRVVTIATRRVYRRPRTIGRLLLTCCLRPGGINSRTTGSAEDASFAQIEVSREMY